MKVVLLSCMLCFIVMVSGNWLYQSLSAENQIVPKYKLLSWDESEEIYYKSYEKGKRR